jgi:hypothetical protein
VRGMWGMDGAGKNFVQNHELVGKRKGEIQFVWPRRIWKVNIKIDLKGILC